MNFVVTIKKILSIAFIMSVLFSFTSPSYADTTPVRWQKNFSCTFAGQSCMATFQVPAGFRLNILFSSSSCNTTSVSMLPNVSIYTTFNGSSGWASVGSLSGIGPLYGSSNINLYADQGTTVEILASPEVTSSNGLTCSFMLSGYIDTNVTM